MKCKHGMPVLGLISAIISTSAAAGTMGPVQVTSSNQLYVGVFGGGGASDHVRMEQYGTAFFLDAAGPLAVDAFGRTNGIDVGFVGAHLGYQWSPLSFDSLSITPAAELEGFYIAKESYVGHGIDNDTTRLPEHDFLNHLPLSSGVFLINSVLNFNPAGYAQWHPYVGAGIGGAVLAIDNADSFQTSPLEAGVNHFNANTHSKDSTFAAQVKAGLRYEYNEHVSLFAEYRWLYLASSDFTFGSTVYPTHVATTNWHLKFGAQDFNLGAAGIRFTI